ncbi:MAG: hypothetical protein WDO72_13885 [Pseudomonadota bacterium]
MSRVAAGLAALVFPGVAAQAATGSIAVGKLGELTGIPGDALEDNTVYKAP